MIVALLKKNELSVLLDYGLQTKTIKTTDTELLLHVEVSHDTVQHVVLPLGTYIHTYEVIPV